MKLKTLQLIFVCGLLATVWGSLYLTAPSADLLACCDPATDPDCGPPPEDEGGDDGDSMPSLIVG